MKRGLLLVVLLSLVVIALASLEDASQHPTKILLENTVIDTTDAPAFDHEHPSVADDSSPVQFHVQLVPPLPPNAKEWMEHEFHSKTEAIYVPHNSFLLVTTKVLAAKAYKKLRLANKVSWIAPVKPYHKVDINLFSKLKNKVNSFDEWDSLTDDEFSEQDLSDDSVEEEEYHIQDRWTPLDILLLKAKQKQQQEERKLYWTSLLKEKLGQKNVGPIQWNDSKQKWRILIKSIMVPKAAYVISSQPETMSVEAVEDFSLQEDDSENSFADAATEFQDSYKQVLEEYTNQKEGTEDQIGLSTFPDVHYLWNKGLTGEGEVIAIGDTGLDYNNCFFFDANHTIPFNRVNTNHRKIVAYYSYADNKDEKDGHGTNVVSVAVGDPQTELKHFKGIAKHAKVAFFDIGKKSGLKIPFDLSEQYFEPLYQSSSKIVSNSWGSRSLGEYTLSAREVDEFSWKHDDFLALYAAGNSGRSGSATLTPPATAKNALVIGASQTSRPNFKYGYPLYSYVVFKQAQRQFCSKSSGIFSREDFCSGFGYKAPCDQYEEQICGKIKTPQDCCSNEYLKGFCCPGTLQEKVESFPEQYSETNMAPFSSRGPTKDLRIKPDIVVPGQLIFGARSDGTSSKYHCPAPLVLQGTSQSTPAAAGYALLIKQYFKKGFYPSGKATAKDAFTPSGALIKAMMINSGTNLDGMVDLNGKGQWAMLNPVPSFTQGFGKVQLSQTMKFEDSKLDLFIRESKLSTGEQDTICLSLQNSTNASQFKVTLVWMDYPAAPNAAITLVNNLDLVVKINGREFLGNGGKDCLNNVEQVVVDKTLLSPTVQVTVIGTNIPHGPQKFALVATVQQTTFQQIKCNI